MRTILSALRRLYARARPGLLLSLALGALLLTASAVPPAQGLQRIHRYTRGIEFDFVAWTLNAAAVKLGQAALGTADYLPAAARKQQVLEYLELVAQIQRKEAEIAQVYSDPAVSDAPAAARPLRIELDGLLARRARLGPLAEAVIQAQLNAVAAEMGLTLGGQTLPPVLYHSTPLPVALIVSPRDAIRQDENLSLIPDLAVDQQAALEEQVDAGLDVSSLVVGIGGVGVYPTMVMQTTDLNWIAEVVAHEWIHNYLTLRPLGASYLNSGELRTMNETAASIAGVELGARLIERYYPEFTPAPPAPPAPAPAPPTPEPPASAPETTPAAPPPFDFRLEMRETRLTVDRLLGAGRILEAEAYMEARRRVFWEQGYRIRKLNQAYFAFYGAYADQPGGAAGEDPVGAAVRLLRQQSPTLAAFINRISWMWSFEQLKDAVGN
jgi:hypothetical protein